MSTMMQDSINGMDKTKRYGWVTKDEPGKLRELHKDILQIHPAYQRELIQSKVKELTASWSYVSAGAIIIGERAGEFWVIDGQHRVVAAKRRSDISLLPCIVFQTNGVKQEAIAFLDVNSGRKPVTSLGKFKAMIAAGDAGAIIVSKTIGELGITLKPTALKSGELKSVGWALRKAKENSESFQVVMSLANDLSKDMPIQEKLLDALWYINERMDGGVSEKRFNSRLRSIGARGLIDAANKAAAYFIKGGAGVWALGVMNEVNSGLRNKFVLKDDT